MIQLSVEELERYRDYVMFEPNTGCELWTGCISHGYPYFYVQKKHRRANRIAWNLAHGEIPDGLLVCHKCDTPLCVNPDHLFLGTAIDNNIDRDRKGRLSVPLGEGHGCAKLTAQQARAIHDRYHRGGITHKKLASEYGVDSTIVGRIAKGKLWRSVLLDAPAKERT